MEIDRNMNRHRSNINVGERTVEKENTEAGRKREINERA